MLALINKVDLTGCLNQKAESLQSAFDTDHDNNSDGFGDSDHDEWNEANHNLLNCQKQPPLRGQVQHQVRQKRGKNLKCPRQQCKRKRFVRKQELVRHYATRRHPSPTFCGTDLTRRGCSLDYKIEEVCPSCSLAFTEASKFGTHQCGASAENRSIIQSQYREMRKDIELKLGLRNPRARTRQLTQSSAPEQTSSEVSNAQASLNMAAFDPEAVLSQLPPQAAAGIRDQSPPILPQLEASNQSVSDGSSRPDYFQLYTLFDGMSGTTQQSQLSEIPSLWQAFDSSNIFLSGNQGMDTSDSLA